MNWLVNLPTPAFCFAIIRRRCDGLAGGDISTVFDLVNYRQYTYVYTMSETKIAHENGWKMNFPFRAGPVFRGFC